MHNYKTEQEAFWAGDFGNEYIDRNNYEKHLSSQLSLWCDILSNLQYVQSFIEFGANIGLNLSAIKTLVPNSELSAIEINQKAALQIESTGICHEVFNQSILNFEPVKKYDVAFISGVLIHQDPSVLADIYDLIYRSSNKYIIINEYYSPNPVEVTYRGYSNKLFKRDFAGEMLDRYPELKLVKYGFRYHRDSHFPQDDLTWFVLEK